jgi:hypothetical protein
MGFRKGFRVRCTVIHKLVEWLLMLWKKVVDGFSKILSAILGGDDEEQPVSDPLDGQPYRQEPNPKPEPAKVDKAPEDPKDEAKKPGEVIPDIPLVCTVTDEKGLTKTELKKLKEKTRRRALRHFAGKEVRHRVTEKKNDLIEFAFFRTSRGQGSKGAPVKIRWQNSNRLPDK